MNHSRTLAAVLTIPAALAVVALAIAQDGERGINHVLGDQDTTAILPAGDVDTWIFDAPEGASVKFTIKAAKSKAPKEERLIPVLALRDPDGQTIPESELIANYKYKPGKSKAGLKNFVITKTGRWAIDITNLGDGQSGAYSITTKAKYPKKLVDPGFSVPQGGTRDVTLPLAGGVTFSVTFLPKSGGKDLGTPRLLDPAGQPVSIATTLWGLSEKGIKSASIEVPLALGDYTLRFTGPSSGGAAGGKLTIKTNWPKRKKVKHTISSDEPIVTGITPNAGNAGTSILVSGSNFANGAELLIGGAPATFVVRNATGTQFTGLAPSGDGVADVAVYNPDGQGMALEDAFTYLPPPTINSVVPNRGPSAGGTPVTITGADFRAGMRVYFGSNPVLTTVTVVNDTTLTVTTPPTASGTYDVEVRNPSNQSATLPNAFTFDRSLRRVDDPFPGNQAINQRLSAAAVGDIDGDGRDDDLVTVFDGVVMNGEDRVPAAGMFFGVSGPAFLDRTLQAWDRPFWPTVVDLQVTFPDGFEPRHDFGAGEGVAIGDLDGDGDQDMVVCANGYYTMNYPLVFLCPSTGVQVQRQAPYSGTYQTAYSGSRILTNDGTGRFTGNVFVYDLQNTSFDSPWPFPLWGEWFQAQAVALGDMDGDQDLDMVLTTNDDFPIVRQYNDGSSCTLSPSPAYGPLRSAALRVLFNDGSGKFSFQKNVVGTTLESFQGVALALGDVDGDNDRDIVVCDTVAPSDGNGGVRFATRVVIQGSEFEGEPSRLPLATDLDDGRASAVVLRDIDGNGRPDIIITTPDELTDGMNDKSSTRIFLNDGSGNFTEVTDIALPAIDARERWQADDLDLADVDGDGDLDLALILDDAIFDSVVEMDWVPSLRILLNNGNGLFSRPIDGFMPGVDLDNGGFPSFLAGEVVRFGDFDGDGDPDLVLGTRSPVEDTPDDGDISPAMEVIRNR